MTNIWADTYKEIRDPFFEMVDPYTNLQEAKGEKEKEEEDENEDDAGEEEEHKYKKSGKKSKDYDGDGEVEDESHEYAGVKDRAIKKAMKMKEERELKSKSSNKKIDVSDSVNNKIDINPSIKEEFEEWVNSIVEEGYDLSEYTWEEMYEIYEENMASDSSKKKAAQAQIRQELADVQLAKANARANQNQTNESVIVYLENRYNL